MIIGLLGQKRVGKDTAGSVIAVELGGTTLAFADPIKRWCMLALKLSEAQLWGDEKEVPFKKSWLKTWNRKTAWLHRSDIGPLPPWADYLADACCISAHESAKVGRAYSQREWWVNSDVNRELCMWWEKLRVEPGLTPRRVMQHFGTECVRVKLGGKFWIDNGLRIARVLLEGGHRYTPVEGLVANDRAMMNAAVFTDCRFRNEVLALKRAGGIVYGITRPGPVDQWNKMKADKKVVRGRVVEIQRHASEQEQLSVPRFWLDGRFINRFGSKEEFELAVRYVARNHISTRGPVVY